MENKRLIIFFLLGLAVLAVAVFGFFIIKKKKAQVDNQGEAESGAEANQEQAPEQAQESGDAEQQDQRKKK